RATGVPVAGERGGGTCAAPRVGRPSGRAASGPTAWPPAPHRQERDVAGPCEAVHCRDEIRVAREIEARRARDPVAQRVGGRTERAPSSIVVRSNGLDPDAPNVESLAGRDLHDAAACPPPTSAQAAWDDDPRLSSETPQRRQVQVIVVRVGDEYHV